MGSSWSVISPATGHVTRSRAYRSLIVFAVLLLPIRLASAEPSITSTFDTDDEGWTAEAGEATMTFQSAGGNPGGFLRFQDTGGASYVVFPPTKFKGNLSAYDRGLLSYDVKVFVPTTPLSSIGSGFGRVQLGNGGSNTVFDYAPNPPIPSHEVWKTYFVPMTAGAWKTTQSNWVTVLSNITTFHITFDLIPGDDTIDFDNVKLIPSETIFSGLLIFDQAGFQSEINENPYVLDMVCADGFATDQQSNTYFAQDLGSSFNIMRSSLTGVTELFAHSGIPEGFARSSLCGLTFDATGKMVLGIQLHSSTGSTVQTVFRVSGFGSAITPVATPTITPPGGTFAGSVDVSLATTTAGAEIRYTLNGTAPSALSPLYTSPIHVSTNSTLQAKGFKSGQPESAIASADFTITPSGATAFQESAGQVVFEAEHYDAKTPRSGHDWTLSTAKSGYSGTGALRATPESGTDIAAGYVTTSPELVFNINISTPGTYYVWMRGFKPDGGADTVHVGIDGTAPSTGANMSQFIYNQWSWIHNAKTVQIPTTGLHTFHIWMREDGFYADKIVLRQGSAGTAPTGTGPAESPRTP